MNLEHCDNLPAGLTMVVPVNTLTTAALIGYWIGNHQYDVPEQLGFPPTHEVMGSLSKHATALECIHQTLAQNGYPISAHEFSSGVVMNFAVECANHAASYGELPDNAAAQAIALPLCTKAWPRVAVIRAIVREAFREN